MTPAKLEDLPDEVLRSVLFHLQPQDALAVGSTSRRFRDVANEPLVWKHYCQHYFLYWHARHRFRSRQHDRSFLGWKGLFMERLRPSLNTEAIINGVITSQTGRVGKIEDISDYGYDAKDTLIRILSNAGQSPNHLAQTYWTRMALGSIHRSMALEEWKNIHNDVTAADSFVRATAAFDLFIIEARPNSGIDAILEELSKLTALIRRQHPEIDAETPRRKARLVAQFLLQHGFTGIHHGRAYHSLEHNFIGVCLSSVEHNSLPLVSVVMYCFILRQLGLEAAPCSFPLHVHAIVRAPDAIDLDGNPRDEHAENMPMYMDPFRSSQEVPLAMLNEQLNIINPQFQPSQRRNFLREATPREITIRCARNIHNSHGQGPFQSFDEINGKAARYGAFWALVLLATHVLHLRQNLSALMQDFTEQFSYDVPLVERYLLPHVRHLPEHAEYPSTCRAIRIADATPKTPKPRSRANAKVKYKVGQVFRHRRYNYVAVVTGWDNSCNAAEEWIQRNQVDRLPDGRNQSFYNVLQNDDGTVRYVAEENIELCVPDKDDLDAFPIEIGKYFKRWDDGAKVFVSNIQDEYPDD